MTHLPMATRELLQQGSQPRGPATEKITVGIKTFKRTIKLRSTIQAALLSGYRKIIVADDGDIGPARRELYDDVREYTDLTVLDLDYDSGLAFGRNRIVRAANTPYILMLDDDQEVMSPMHHELQLMEKRPELGGISASLIEGGSICQRANDLAVRNGYLIKHYTPPPESLSFSGRRYFIFDQIPNATLFKIECLQDIAWDERFVIGREHVDFYLSHKRRDDWKFAVTPDAFVLHRRGGSGEYEEEYRFDEARLAKSDRHLAKKWNIEGVITGRQFNVHSKSGWREEFAWKMLDVNIGTRLVGRLFGQRSNWYVKSKRLVRRLLRWGS